MTTDTKTIASLPPCGRRWIATNQDGVQIWCRPPTRPPELTAAEAIKDPAKWFQKRQVSCAMCLGCNMMEPDRVEPQSFETTLTADPKDHPESARRRESEQEQEHKPPKVLDDGKIIYEKTGWEPPPVPVGYRRKSEDLKNPDAWILVRTEPLCKYCKLVQVEKPNCKCTRIIPTCTYNGKSANIQLHQCDTCPDRK